MLELRGVSKQFGAFRALNALNFTVRAGEIVALLGENGAGKSTTINLIGGNLAPDAGQILWRDKEVWLRSPRDATALGIGVVHQHFRLVPAFTVAENLALQGQRDGLIFSARDWKIRIDNWAQSLGWNVDAMRRVGELSVGQRQRVEILKALFTGNADSGAQLLLMDEPTANLTPREREELFVTLRNLTVQGRAIVFVSHKLDEVLGLCDRVCVLRRGELVGEKSTQNTTQSELATLMVGRDVHSNLENTAASTCRQAHEPVLQLKNLSFGGLKAASVQVLAGEIVGIAGVDGNGQKELSEVLCGLASPSGGNWHCAPNGDGSAGLALIPPDRQDNGLILGFDLAENLALHPLARREFAPKWRFDWAALRAKTRDLMKDFDVRAPQTLERTAARQLSGGNQQKLVIARALSFPHRAILACDPTRGLDFGATQFVHEQLHRAARNGAGILLISSDLDEIFTLCDRIGVLFEGRLLPDEPLLKPETTREHIGALMGGEAA